MNRLLIVLLIAQLFTSTGPVTGQDTFSIVAVDSTTGEVGAAGASCVDLDLAGFATDHFIAELFPGNGAIATQAWYLPGNQEIARTRMMIEEHPDSIIQWLVENDIQGLPGRRQYGIAAIRANSIPSAGFTGNQTDDYKGHITGPGYSIQGNILLGAGVLEDMETMFLEADGTLQCRLMAALQGAKRVGADSRCAPNGTSSLFAFVKVADPEDAFGEPSFVRSVRTGSGDGVEPIDSLQRIFDADGICSVSGTGSFDALHELKIFPNPCREEFYIENAASASASATLFTIDGLVLHTTDISDDGRSVSMNGLAPGVYYLQVREAGNSTVHSIVRL